MRVLVCGGRDYNDREAVISVLSGIAGERMRPIETIIEGGAKGADASGRAYAYITDAECETYEADWKRFGNRAGPIRNQRMIDEGKPDLVVAFPGGRGTADMVRRAKAAGVPVTLASGGDVG